MESVCGGGTYKKDKTFNVGRYIMIHMKSDCIDESINSGCKNIEILKTESVGDFCNYYNFAEKKNRCWG